MFGRNGVKPRPAAPSARPEAPARPEPEAPAAPTTLLTIVGQEARVEGKFEDKRVGAHG